jgi:hypothetical protein
MKSYMKFSAADAQVQLIHADLSLVTRGRAFEVGGREGGFSRGQRADKRAA